MKAKRHDLDKLTEADAIAAQLSEPVNCELHLGITAQRVLREALLDATDSTEYSEGVHHILDSLKATLAETLIHPVKR